MYSYLEPMHYAYADVAQTAQQQPSHGAPLLFISARRPTVAALPESALAALSVPLSLPVWPPVPVWPSVPGLAASVLVASAPLFSDIRQDNTQEKLSARCPSEQNRYGEYGA